jgi:hypothetical protein
VRFPDSAARLDDNPHHRCAAMTAFAAPLPAAVPLAATGVDRSIMTQAVVLALCTMALFIGGGAAAAYFDDTASQTVVITGNFAARTQADYGTDAARAVAVAPQRPLPAPIRATSPITPTP